MLSLYILSVVVFLYISLIAIRSLNAVIKNGLGIEEITLIAVIILSCINISIDVANIFGNTVWVTKFFAHISYGSRVFQALLSYCAIHYINKIHSIRIEK